MSQEEWKEAFEKYQRFPEYQKKNHQMELEGFKSIYFWEYLHRMWGRLMGIVFIVPFGIFLYQGKIKGELLKRCLLILLGGALVAGLGWFMVLSGLKDHPDVSHYRLAIHLTAAFSLFGYVLWSAFDLRWPRPSDPPPEHRRVRSWSWSFLLLLMVQIVYGAFVAGSDAGHLFNTWPKMQGAWIPDAVSTMEPFWLNFLEGRAALQFVHRSLGVLVLLFGIGILSMILLRRHLASLRKAALFFGGTLLLQFLLGVFTLVLEVPLSLAVLHQVGALFLMGTVLFLAHRASLPAH